jgi:hypothetical protein
MANHCILTSNLRISRPEEVCQVMYAMRLAAPSPPAEREDHDICTLLETRPLKLEFGEDDSAAAASGGH